MPLYNTFVASGSNSLLGNINSYPVYQGFMDPCYINGVRVPLSTEKSVFFNYYPNIVQQFIAVGTGDGTATYTLNIPVLGNNSTPLNVPINALCRGHINIAGILQTGSNTDPIVGTTLDTTINLANISPSVYITSLDANGSPIIVSDSGQFLDDNPNLGLLMAKGNYPNGYQALTGGYSTTSNIIDYFNGVAYVTFPSAIPSGVNIDIQVRYFQSGLPRSILFYDNILTFRAIPDKSYLVEIDGYMTPAAFLNTTDAIPFGYMSEYIARGAARKILSDTGDIEQLQFYEPLFREQEMLVVKRSERQKTATRTQTIYSAGINHGSMGTNLYGGY